MLQKGDVVLTTSTDIESRLIKIGTFSDISHAMICVARGSVMDATREGVQSRNVQKMFYPDSCAIYILRLKQPLDDSQLDEVVNFIRAEAGTPYALGEAVVSVAKVGIGSSKQFCSRLVARAFASIGVELVKNPNFCTPADLKRSQQLTHVENPAMIVSEDEVKAIEELGDQTIGMRAITNSLLAMARNIAPRIRCINDISRVAIERPEHDGALAVALKESGYLGFWKEEINKHPWRYDPVKIVQFYHAISDRTELFNYCHRTLDDDQNGVFRHWRVSMETLGELNKQYPRKSLSLLQELYLQLNFHHHLRVISAQTLMKVYGTKKFN